MRASPICPGLLLLLLLPAACQDKQKSTENSRTGGNRDVVRDPVSSDQIGLPALTKAADYRAPAAVRAWSEEEAKNLLLDVLPFYAPVKTSEDGPQDELVPGLNDCLKPLLDDGEVRAGGNGFQFVVEMDAAGCLAGWPVEKGVTLTVHQYDVTFGVSGRCAGADFSDLDGASPVEVSDDFSTVLFCPDGDWQEYEMVTATSMDITLKWQNNGIAQSSRLERDVFRVQGNLAGGPCRVERVDGTLVQEEGCADAERAEDLSLRINGIAQTPEDPEYRLYDKSGLASEPDPAGPWYTSGVMGITLGNWQGTATFGGDSTTAPRWKLTSGGETIKGTLEEWQQP